MGREAPRRILTQGDIATARTDLRPQRIGLDGYNVLRNYS
jgi:hypothetical protein